MIKTAIATIVLTGMIQANVRYDIKSAQLEFTFSSIQKVGSVTIEKKGSQRVLIDHYGKQELVERQITEKRGIREHHIHTLRYIHGNVAYNVRFKAGRIDRVEHYKGQVFGIMKQNGSYESMLQKMQYVKTGTDSVAGQPCDVWEYRGGRIKQCIYKGLPLKKEAQTNSMHELLVATKVKINTPPSRADFKLPDLPIDGKRYTQAQLEQMDSHTSEHEQKKQQSQDRTATLMQQAYQYAGVKRGAHPTKEQTKIIRTYMENAMFPQRKKALIAARKKIPLLKSCYQKAMSMKEAYQCDTDADFESYRWGEKEKDALLKQLEAKEKQLPCIEKAKNMDEIKGCFPKETA